MNHNNQQPGSADLLSEVAEVLAENNWRGDLQERLRDAIAASRRAEMPPRVTEGMWDSLTAAHKQYQETAQRTADMRKRLGLDAASPSLPDVAMPEQVRKALEEIRDYQAPGFRLADDEDLAHVQSIAIDALAAQPAEGSAQVAIRDYKPGQWFDARTLDEMQSFYLSRLPAIREAAKQHGYAIGLHGSERRDFDLMAMQWREGASDKDTLARAIADAACGIRREGAYDWESKPSGRVATSIPVCWTAHDNPDFDKPSVGHIDLSLIESVAVVRAVPARLADENAGTDCLALPVQGDREIVGFLTQANVFVPLAESTRSQASLYGWREVFTDPPSAAEGADTRCTTCDGTRSVHRADGEYMGECNCGAAEGATQAGDAQEELARTESELSAILPGQFYMDEPDGGSVTLVEQLRRMARDATRFRWLNYDHDDPETRDAAFYLANRLATSSYFSITRDIDVAMKECEK